LPNGAADVKALPIAYGRELCRSLGRVRAEPPAADLAVPLGRDELIADGPRPSDDGATWLGTAVLVRALGQDTARAVLTADRYVGIEVHSWQFRGRS
jgi:hypothetical protein